VPRIVSGAFDGDLIRPLGLVTLYCAYAEGEIDELLLALSSLDPLDNATRQWTVGQKLARATQLIERLQRKELSALLETLADARRLFERRNALIHGRLYAGGRLVSSRAGVPDQRVTPQELNEFAELVSSCKERLWMNRCRHLLPVLESHRAGSGT
jgi:hypothetical protein